MDFFVPSIGKRIDMKRVLPGFVKRGVKAIGSRVIDWLREWTKPDNHGVVGGVVVDATRSNSELCWRTVGVIQFIRN